MGASSELPHGCRGGRLGRTRLLRLGRHLRHLEVLTRSARRAAAPTFALAVAAAFLLPGGEGTSSRHAAMRVSMPPLEQREINGEGTTAEGPGKGK